MEKQTTLKPEKLEAFRKLLTQKINELLNEAGKTVSEMTSGKENFPDPNDRASLESDRNFELRIRDRERKLIVKMQEAIKRIDDGVYGICDSCGGPISEKDCWPGPSRPSASTAKPSRKKWKSSKANKNRNGIQKSPASRGFFMDVFSIRYFLFFQKW